MVLSSVSGSPSCRSVGRVPPKYFSTMAVVRLTQVAQVVGQVGVDAADEGLVGEVAVGAEGELPQQEVAQGVHPVALGQQVGVHHVALGLGHLAPSSSSQPWPNTRLGRGRSRAISMAGHRMVWKRRISLPTMCRSAGQNLS